MNGKLSSKEREIPRCWDRGAETEVLRQRCWDGAVKEFSNQASASQRETEVKKWGYFASNTFPLYNIQHTSSHLYVLCLRVSTAREHHVQPLQWSSLSHSRKRILLKLPPDGYHLAITRALPQIHHLWPVDATSLPSSSNLCHSAQGWEQWQSKQWENFTLTNTWGSWQHATQSQNSQEIQFLRLAEIYAMSKMRSQGKALQVHIEYILYDYYA